MTKCNSDLDLTSISKVFEENEMSILLNFGGAVRLLINESIFKV